MKFAKVRVCIGTALTSPIQPIPKNPVPGILFTSGLPQMTMKYTP